MTFTQQQIHPDFSAAAKLFEGFTANEEAQLAVYAGGELVLDLASNYSADALSTVYSVSKGLSAIALAHLVAAGSLDLDQTVAHYWPEFAAQGKSSVTVRQLLSHQAGLPETDAGLTAAEFLDDHAAAAALAAQKPFWRPGSGFGYHALSIGPLMSELCFRITGQTIQQYYETNVRVPAGADAYLGLPENLESRVAELLPAPVPTQAEAEKFGIDLGARPSPIDAHVGRPLSEPFITSAAGRRFGLPSAGAVASARGLAAVFQWASGFGASQGGIPADVLAEFAQAQVFGRDQVSNFAPRSHGIVFMKPTAAIPFGSHQAFGHDGLGGAIVLADPASQVVLGYSVRRMTFPGGVDRRLQPVIDAVHAAARGLI